MQALWLEVPEHFLEERRRLGHDKKDELWDGVLHMVPPPVSRHQRLSADLLVGLHQIARRFALEPWGDSTGVFGPGENWRIPDLTFARPDHRSERGLESAELVIEILSPNDESRKKLPFYASIGVREVWIIDPVTRVAEIFAGTTPVLGGVSAVLGVRLETVGALLRIHDGESFTDV